MEKYFSPPSFFFSSAKPIIVESLGRDSTNCRKNAAEFKASSACVCVMADYFIRFLHSITERRYLQSIPLNVLLFPFFRIKCCQTRLPNWIAVMESKR